MSCITLLPLNVEMQRWGGGTEVSASGNCIGAEMEVLSTSKFIDPNDLPLGKCMMEAAASLLDAKTIIKRSAGARECKRRAPVLQERMAGVSMTR
jgi:hypothetical protein